MKYHNWFERYADTVVGPALQSTLDQSAGGPVTLVDCATFFSEESRMFFCHAMRRGRDVGATFAVPESVVLGPHFDIIVKFLNGHRRAR